MQKTKGWVLFLLTPFFMTEHILTQQGNVIESIL